MQPLQELYPPTIGICREILCLPYGEFLLKVMVLQGKCTNQPSIAKKNDLNHTTKFIKKLGHKGPIYPIFSLFYFTE